MQATLAMRDHAGTGTLDAYFPDRYVGQIARIDTRYVVLPSPARRIVMYDILSDAVRDLEAVAAEPGDGRKPYVFDGYDTEEEYATSVAGWCGRTRWRITNRPSTTTCWRRGAPHGRGLWTALPRPEEPVNENEELTMQEAAERKGVRVQTIHAAIKSGRLAARVDLPPGYARGRWIIRREDLDAWQPVRDAVQRGRRGGRPKKVDEPSGEE